MKLGQAAWSEYAMLSGQAALPFTYYLLGSRRRDGSFALIVVLLTDQEHETELDKLYLSLIDSQAKFVTSGNIDLRMAPSMWSIWHSPEGESPSTVLTFFAEIPDGASDVVFHLSDLGLEVALELATGGDVVSECHNTDLTFMIASLPELNVIHGTHYVASTKFRPSFRVHPRSGTRRVRYFIEPDRSQLFFVSWADREEIMDVMLEVENK